MVDVDRRRTGLTQAHLAGLRRLSARAAAASSTPTLRNSLLTLSPLTHLRNSGIQINPGLTETELTQIEAEFGFQFPPDLRVILSTGLPVGVGFPDWRSPGETARALIDLPIASVSFQIEKNSLWCNSWGLKPPDDPEKALRVVRKAPLMIPVFDRCYIPSNPVLAGNPVFFIDETRIFCCGSDLSEFFEREFAFRSSDRKSVGSSSNFSSRSDRVNGSGKSRWVEFWSDAAVDRCRRSSSSSSSSSSPENPTWVNQYVNRIGSVLRSGGWSESDIDEIIHVSASGRLSDSLRESGWSSEEVSDTFGFDFRPEKERKPVKKLSHALVERIEKLAERVYRS